MKMGRETGASKLAAALICSIGIAAAEPATAGVFGVNPVQINLPSSRKAASLTITNSDAAPVSVRVRTYIWTQVNGKDVHTPTTNVIASPPIFTIPAGKKQLVRVGLRKPGSASAYRVVFEEIPTGSSISGQIKVLLTLNLPLYIVPAAGGKPDLRWKAWRDHSGDTFVEGRNHGPVHGQVLELSAQQPSGNTILSKQMGVILPASARVWKVGQQPGFKVGAPLMLKVRSGSNETRSPIVLEQR